jgi:addiction module HigA family antidote
MRFTKKKPPIHPGEVLLEEFVKPLGYTQKGFASLIGWTEADLSKIVKGKMRITAARALDLVDAVGMDVVTWTNIQLAVDVWNASQERMPVRRIKSNIAVNH